MMPDKLLNAFANFEQWRANKLARNTATPKHLRLQAIALVSHYSRTTIVSKLRISIEQLNRWSLADKAPDKSPQFVHLPQETLLPETLSIELKFSNGNQLVFSGELNERVLTQLIEAVKL